MPEYDGFYALEKIKAANPEAKIVMLTSNASQTVAEKLQRLGSSRIIPKPFEANMIIDVIDELRNQDKHKPHPKEILVG
jgi:DNA-binding NarL/FixJ family response regulator